jgi:Leucine-rich repeat (LRR) protein
LQVLVASHNSITSLPPSLHLLWLRELWLGGNRLAAAHGGPRWPWLPSLHLLHLEDNQLASLATMQASSQPATPCMHASPEASLDCQHC